MKRKIADSIFIGIILVVLCTGLVTALFADNEINEYENRYSEKFETLSVESYLSGDFQSSAEAALADRVNFAERMKKIYNDFKGRLVHKAVDLGQDENRETVKYIKVGDKNVIGDNVIYNTSVFEQLKGMLDERIVMYNSICEKNPEVEFYLYYVEKDTDINFETGEKVGVFEYLYDNLNFKKENMATFRIDNFDQFKTCFYKTDHHWKEDGSYKGYVEVLKLLDENETPVEKGEKVLIADKFSGSKAIGETAGYTEEFWAYRYETVPMKTVQNGKETKQYGLQDEFMAGEKPMALSYAAFYGTDDGEVILDTGNIEKANVLIVGESYDNAILKLLGGHFNKTHAVDLRYYEHYKGKKFNLGEYVKENDIDKVLFMGNVDYIILDVFDVEE